MTSRTQYDLMSASFHAKRAIFRQKQLDQLLREIAEEKAEQQATAQDIKEAEADAKALAGLVAYHETKAKEPA